MKRIITLFCLLSLTAGGQLYAQKPTGCPTNVVYGQNGGTVYVRNATTWALINAYGGGANSYSLAVTMDAAYMVPNNLGGGGFITKTDLTTGAVTNTGIQLPTVVNMDPAGQTWYISGSADPQGNIYFVTARGENLFKVNPATGVLTTVWKKPGTGGPAGPPPPTAAGFTSEGMDMSIDANGDLYFIADVSYKLWQVPAGALTPIYRGQFSLPAFSGSVNDIFFANGSVYLAGASTTRIFKADMGTMTATAVNTPPTMQTFTDGAGTLCDLLSLAPLNGKILIDPDGQTGGVNGTPAAGVTVTLYAADGVTVIATTTTDADGNYHFNNLAANTTYVVGITPPAGMRPVSSTDATPSDGKTTITTPASGNVTTSVDFGINTTPVVNPDFNATYINVPVTGNLSTNDKSTPGVTPTYKNAPTIPAGSSNPNTTDKPVINPDGTYTFTGTQPGVYTFDVPVCSGTPEVCTNNRLTITVADKPTPTNPVVTSNPPVANPDIATTKGTNPVTIKTLANDQPGANSIVAPIDPTSVKVNGGTSFTTPNGGTVTVNTTTGDITYTPAAGFTGVDTYPYTVCDKAVPPKCATSYQQVTVLPANAPNSTSASDDYVITQVGTAVSGNVKTNDIDPEGNPTTVTPVAGQTVLAPDGSTAGTITINADGSYTFTPATGYTGPANVSYNVCDNGTPQACTNATLYLLVTPQSIILPVKLVSFTGSVANCNTTLQWQTASEMNFDRFEVEQSADGMKFEQTGAVPSAKLETGSRYSYKTTASQNGQYYRLKMIDIDNKFYYSEVLPLRNNCSKVSFAVSPNPARELVNITGTIKGDLIYLYNGVGKLIVNTSTNGNAKTINLSGLPSGIYILVIQRNNEKLLTEKIIKL